MQLLRRRLRIRSFQKGPRRIGDDAPQTTGRRPHRLMAGASPRGRPVLSLPGSGRGGHSGPRGKSRVTLADPPAADISRPGVRLLISLFRLARNESASDFKMRY